MDPEYELPLPQLPPPLPLGCSFRAAAQLVSTHAPLPPAQGYPYQLMPVACSGTSIAGIPSSTQPAVNPSTAPLPPPLPLPPL